ncbi:MAG: succinate dehydrogenase/fumarate reductase iron-sulfur subunit [Pikeienuella sp.]
MDEAHAQTLSLRIWRGGPDGTAGAHETYEVPARENQTVLDAVTEVQRRHAPDLAYRFACRVGVCGSCAMTVNGRPRWTCRTHVQKVAQAGEITVEPLRNLPRIRDLVVDMDPFFDKWGKVGGFEGTATRDDAPAAVDPSGRERREADAAIQCINCAVCYAACDVVSWDTDYLGPAALNRAWTLLNDPRAANRSKVKATALGTGGCGSCHTHGACMAACPVGLSPTRSIAGIKRRSLLDLFGGA